MLRLSDAGGVHHVKPVPHHAIPKPSEKQAQEAVAKILNHLTGVAKEKCDAEIDTLRRYLCLPC